jgi:hypothetical protein
MNEAGIAKRVVSLGESGTHAMDRVRRHALSAIGPVAPWLLRDRERRVLVYGLFAIASALTMTIAAPMVLLAIGPLVLGVPHLVADLRYLVMREELYRRGRALLFIGVPIALSFIYSHAWISMFAVIGGAIAASNVSLLKRIPVIAIAAALIVACFRWERSADLLLAHLHNAIAIGLFAMWRPGASSETTTKKKTRGRLHLWIVAAFFAVVIAIAFGALDGRPGLRLLQSTLLDPESMIASLTPAFDSEVWSLRAVLVFAFAQSVHYAVWVRLVPEEDRPRAGLRSFTSSLRALRSDLGLPLLLLAMIGALTIAIWAAFSLSSARDGYLRLAIFHGPLELGAATLLLLERGYLGGQRQVSDVKPQ